MNGFTKTLKIEVDTKYDNDDDHGYNGVYGKLKIELKGKDRQVLAGADVYGSQTWTGLLCDGTNATVNYTVAQDGTLTVDDVAVADGASYSVDNDGNGFTDCADFSCSTSMNTALRDFCAASAETSSSDSTVTDDQPSRWPLEMPLRKKLTAPATSRKLIQLSRARGILAPRPGR